MIDGIEVLNQWTETIKSGWASNMFDCGVFMTIVCGLFAVLLTVIYFVEEEYELSGGVITFWILTLIGTILFSIGLCNRDKNIITTTTYYQVTISDKISMIEFSEKYEIVQKDGKIYTIKEIE